jgi:hypothetical protein
MGSNNLVYTTTARADGTGLEIPTALANGTWYFRAKQTDIAGNTSGLGNQHYVVVDTVNAAPVITSVMDNVGPVTGNVANAGSTDDNTPTLNGTAEAGSTVYIAVNGATYSVTAATNGSWSLHRPHCHWGTTPSACSPSIRRVTERGHFTQSERGFTESDRRL